MDKKKVTKVESSKSSDKVSIKFPNLTKLFLHPKSFVSEVEKETKYENLIRVFVIISLAYFIIGTLANLFLNQFNISDIFLSLINSLMIALAFPFVFAAIVLVGLKVLKVKANFFTTYKSSIYTMIIGIIYSVIILLVSIIIKLIIPFDSSMLQTIQTATDPANISQAYTAFFSQPGAIVLVIAVIILYIIMIIHELYFLTNCLSKFNNIKKSRAFLAIIIPFIVIFIIFLIIAFLLGSFA